MTYKEMSRQKHRKQAAFKRFMSYVCFFAGFAMYIGGIFNIVRFPRIATASIILGIELVLKVGRDTDWWLRDDDPKEDDDYIYEEEGNGQAANI